MSQEYKHKINATNLPDGFHHLCYIYLDADTSHINIYEHLANEVIWQIIVIIMTQAISLNSITKFICMENFDYKEPILEHITCINKRKVGWLDFIKYLTPEIFDDKTSVLKYFKSHLFTIQKCNLPFFLSLKLFVYASLNTNATISQICRIKKLNKLFKVQKYRKFYLCWSQISSKLLSIIMFFFLLLRSNIRMFSSFFMGKYLVSLRKSMISEMF